MYTCPAMHALCAIIYMGEVARVINSFCVESIHSHPDITKNYFGFKNSIHCTELFVLKVLDLAPKLSSLMILSGWFAASLQGFSTKKEIAQSNIDQVYKSEIRRHYQIVKSDEITFSPLRTMHRSNLAEMTAQYGHYLYHHDRYQEAKKYYNQAIANNPNHLTAYNQQGMCFANMGEYEQARHAFFEILPKTTHAQTLADAHLNIAWTLRLEIEKQPELEKKTEQALDHMAKAKQLAPHDLMILAEERNILALRFAKSYANRGFFFQPSIKAITPDQCAMEIQAKMHGQTRDR